MSSFASDIGVLNDEIMRLVSENAKLKQKQNDEIEEGIQNKIGELLGEIKELTERNKILETKVMKSVTIEQYNQDIKASVEQLKETQDKLKIANEKLEIQQELTLKLKSHLPSNSEISEDPNSQIDQLKQKLSEVLQEKSALEMEISEMQINHQAEVDTLTDKLITQSEQLKEINSFESKYKESQNKIDELNKNLSIMEQVNLVNKKSLNHEIELRLKAENVIEDIRNKMIQYSLKFENEFSTSQIAVDSLVKMLNCTPTDIVPYVQSLLVSQEKIQITEAKNKELEQQIKEHSETSSEQNDYVKELEDERKRSQELALELETIRQTVIEQNEQIELLREENDKKIDEMQQLHEIEIRNFQDELDLANTKIAQLEQIKVPSSVKSGVSSNSFATTSNSRNATPILTAKSITPLKSKNSSSHTTPIRSLIHPTPNTEQDSDSDEKYLEKITDFIDIISIYCKSDDCKDNEALRIIGDLFSMIIERPFNQDQALTCVETMIETLNNMEVAIWHANDIKNAFEGEISSFGIEVCEKIQNLEEQLKDINKKVASSKPGAFHNSKRMKSKIPMLTKRTGEIPPASPLKRSLINDPNPQSVRIPFQD